MIQSVRQASRGSVRLYVLAGLCGALLMALEILASRILAPHFGNSVYVWGSIISVFLAALSLGYVGGGRLVDRAPDLGLLGVLLLGSGAWLLALRIWGARLAEVLADFTSSSPLGTLLAATLLFGPPSVGFGAASPFVVRLAAHRVEQVGDTAGRLYAISTLGSLAGTLLCTFVAIPNFRVTTITAVLVLGTAIAALIALQSPLPGRRRSPSSTLAVVLALAGLWSLRSPLDSGGTVQGIYSTPYQTVEVRESLGVRSIRSDGITQSAIHVSDGTAASRYFHYAPAAFLVQPNVERVLVIGMGGGLLSQTLRDGGQRVEIDFVEIDPRMPDIAQRHGFWSPRAGDHVHIADGRQFLRRAEFGAAWDYIYVDAYIGLAVPFHLTTREFFELAAARLVEGGVVGVNLAAGLRDPFSRAVLHTLRGVFAATYVVDVEGANNVLLLATQIPREDHATFVQRASNWSPSGLRVAPRRLAAAIREEAVADAGEEYVVLRDDFAPAEHLVWLGQRDFDLSVFDMEPLPANEGPE